MLRNVSASSSGNTTFPAITALHLIEDFDGIAPASCTLTCDQTPTVTWGASGGTAPYSYYWQLYTAAGNSQTLYLSGSTSAGSYQFPTLPPDDYRLFVQVGDRENDFSVWSYLDFTVYVCAPPVVVETPTEDLPLAVRPGPGYIRYLPQWLALFGTAERSGTESLLYKVLRGPLDQFLEVDAEVQRLVREHALVDAPCGVARLAWQLQSRFLPRDPVTVTFQASGVSGTVTRVETERQFLAASGAVFLVGEQGLLLFRNLGLRTLAVTGSNGRYQIPEEPLGVLGDVDLLLETEGVAFRLPAGSRALDPANALFQVPSSLSGTLQVTYESLTLLSALTVSVSGQPRQSPTPCDLWNPFDEWGLLLGMERAAGEDNRRYRDRMLARLWGTRGSDLRALGEQVAQELRLITLLSWDGQTTLNFNASGYHGIRTFSVVDLPQWGRHQEELFPVSGGVYSTSKRQWRAGYELTVDGVPVSPLRYPDLAFNGNLLTLGSSTSGRVEAFYQYPHYELTTNSLGYITAVTPVSGNTPSGNYRIVLTHNVRAHTPRDPEFVENYLLEGDGQANAYYRELREALLQDSMVHVGRARWGPEAYWGDPQATEPEMAYLPSLFDREGS